MVSRLRYKPGPQDLRDLRARATETFGQHRITEVRLAVWRCARLGSFMYSFQVAALPGCVVLWGDIGAVMYQIEGSEWAFLSRMTDDRGYVMGRMADQTLRNTFSAYWCYEALWWFTNHHRDEIEALWHRLAAGK